ncbi:MAG: GldG family protein [Ruthenibacterium sp.]
MKSSSKIKEKKNKFIASSVIVLVLLIAFVTLTVLTAFASNFKLDLTEQKIFTLTEESENVLRQVQDASQKIRIAAVYPTGNEEAMVVNLLKEYKSKAPNLEVEYMDAEKDPSKLAAYPLGDILAVNNGSIIVTCGERVKVINNSDLFESSQSGTYFYGEREITGAIRYVAAEKLPTVYFTAGHGEISAGKNLTQAVSELKRNAYEAKSLVLLQEGIPQDASIIVMASPTEDISLDEKAMLQKFLDGGGKLMLLVDPFMTTNENILDNVNQLVNGYGIDISNNYVKEEDSKYYMAASDLYLIPRFSSHEITAAIGESERMVVLPMARGLGAAEYDEQAIKREVLLLSSEKAWARNDMTLKSGNKTNTDIAGPIVLGFAAEKNKTAKQPISSKVVVFGDSNFIVDGNYTTQANSVLFINSVNWLQGGHELHQIIGKKVNSDTLLVRGNEFTKLVIICCLVLPLIAFAGAIFIWYSKRNR